MQSYISPAEHARFQSKYTVQPNGCWLWDGPLDKDGYGTFYFRRRNRRAHRVGWYSANGEVAAGHVINHTCRNRSCVNPQHLNSVTVEENVLRDSVALPYINSQKTRCPRNHEYDGTYVNKRTGRTQRTCSACSREKQKRLRKKWRAEDSLNV